MREGEGEGRGESEGVECGPDEMVPFISKSVYTV